MNYRTREDINYVEDHEKNISPNRIAKIYTKDVISCIANFVDKVPYLNVGFTEDLFTLSFNRYVKRHETHSFENSVMLEFDQVRKEIISMLNNENHKVKLSFVSLDLFPASSSTYTSTNFACRATYRIS